MKIKDDGRFVNKSDICEQGWVTFENKCDIFSKHERKNMSVRPTPRMGAKRFPLFASMTLYCACCAIPFIR